MRFHRIRVQPEDIEETAFKTSYGHFEFLFMPMGLRNTTATLQSLMENILHDCIDILLFIYIDDLHIFGKIREDHIKHLEIMLSRYQKENMYVAPNKFSFMEN